MKAIKHHVKSTQFNTVVGLLFILALAVAACNKDGDVGDETEQGVSTVKFSISGSILNGDYEYKDANADDAFSTISMFYSKASDPDLSDDQIQLYIGKSYMSEYFLLVAPPEKGTHQIGYGENDFDVSINISPDEDYNAKQVTVTIAALDIAGRSVKHCKGTFSGSFYRNNLVEANVHEISGSFEIN